MYKTVKIAVVLVAFVCLFLTAIFAQEQSLLLREPIINDVMPTVASDAPFVDTPSPQQAVTSNGNTATVEGEQRQMPLPMGHQMPQAEPCSPTPPALYEYRTWTSNGGNFTVEAKFVKWISCENIVLERKADNKQIQVSVDRLSQRDKRYINSLDVLVAFEPSTTPVALAAIDKSDKITINGTITRFDILVHGDQMTMDDFGGIIVDSTDAFPKTENFVGRGYSQSFTSDEVYFLDLDCRVVPLEEAAKRLQENPAVFLGYGCGVFISDIETLSSDTLVLVDFNSNGFIDIDATTFQWQDKPAVPMPPVWFSFEITDGKAPSQIYYIARKLVYETRQRQYTVEKGPGLHETRTANFTIVKFIPETCVMAVPDVEDLFDRDISDIKKLTGVFPVSYNDEPIDPAYLSLFKEGVPIIVGEKLVLVYDEICEPVEEIDEPDETRQQQVTVPKSVY